MTKKEKEKKIMDYKEHEHGLNINIIKTHKVGQQKHEPVTNNKK